LKGLEVLTSTFGFEERKKVLRLSRRWSFEFFWIVTPCCGLKTRKNSNYLTNPQSRNLKKMAVAQLVNKFPHRLCNQKVHWRVQNNLPLDPTLNHLNPFKNLTLCFI